MTKCDRCYASKHFCDKCIDNPIYEDVPKTSMYQDYPICCPYRGIDCIHDPGYEYVFHRKFYERWNGSIPYSQAKCIYEGVCENFEYYDSEDK